MGSASGTSPAAAPANTWSGVGTEGFRLKKRSFFSMGLGSGRLPTSGPSSTGISIWGTCWRRAALSGSGARRRSRGLGSGSSSSSYSTRGRSRIRSTISTGETWNTTISMMAAIRTKITPAPYLLNTAVSPRAIKPLTTPPLLRASPWLHRVLTSSRLHS